ncbi:uncharacterized protein LOC118428473 [Branchiostoma floridae]|uniref:Uncharacterized protein LOC118428473 n=1 Tax=Branchiostoma floridae TaxID=7739 RepID=A0A9J7M558_BRAFL|nr:uncharacterized protein LOC118428473 [Branchiostoma floridae]
MRKFLLVLLIVCVVAWESVGSTRTLRRIYTRRRPTIAPLASCPEPFTAPGTIKYNCNPPYVHGEACWWRCPPRYRYQSGSPVRQCKDGQWTGTIMFCVPDLFQALFGN